MNQTKKLVTLMLFVALLAFNTGKAQNSLTRSFVNYSFSADSLRGFEEEAAKASAISEGFLGVEFPVRMFQLKRAYINAKYHIKPTYTHNFSAVQKVTSVVPACVNEDFEASAAGPIVTSGQVSGWTVTGGSNSGVTGSNCTLLGCCPSPPAQSAIQHIHYARD